ATCLALAALFLYNPFLGDARNAGNLSVCHPASHRATVGSSELESFAKPAASLATVEAAQIAPGIIALLAAPAELSQSSSEPQVVAKPRAGFSSSLWFRPPPAA